MEQVRFEIIRNERLTESVFEMKLQGSMQDLPEPGQFVNIALDGHFLRRPISVCHAEPGLLTLIYKVVGSGTEQMASFTPGQQLDVLCGLGHGYDLSKAADRPLLIGGGVGVPPLYYLCEKLLETGKDVTVILGFNSKSEIFYEKEFKALGAQVLVTTVDGSYGIRGFVTDAMKDLDYSFFYTCGPMPMLKAVYRCTNTSGEFSFEERMGCGFGACMGCSCKTVSGTKRICREGPVLTKEEIIWQTQE